MASYFATYEDGVENDDGRESETYVNPCEVLTDIGERSVISVVVSEIPC